MLKIRRLTGMRAAVIPLAVVVPVLALSRTAGATIIDVPDDQSTIQAGIDAAIEGDTVLVAPGYYVENVRFKGKEVVLSSHFMLERNPDYIFSTTIDGSGATSGDTTTTVMMAADEGKVPVLQGFTITGGYGTPMYDPGESHVFRNGGGVATSQCSAIIQFNYIHGNRPSGSVNYGGGGVYLQLGAPVVANNMIVDNPGLYGCGVCCRASDVTLRNNLIANNEGGSQYGGAGVYVYEGTLLCENNTIVYNQSVQPGGGIRVVQADATVRNTIAWFNSGPQLLVWTSGSITAEYSNIQYGWTGTGNIAGNPLLSISDDRFYTLSGSPCIDAGNPSGEYDDIAAPWLTGQARWPSRGALRNDIGASGGPGAYPFELANIDADTRLIWVNQGVAFSAESYFDVDSWLWDFGDQQTSSSATPTHVYGVPGQFDVSLSVSHDGGQIYESSREEFVVVLADTIWTDDVVLTESGSSVPIEVSVVAHNTIGLHTITIPVEYSGSLDLVYDHFSVEGCRTEGFSRAELVYHDPGLKVLYFELEADAADPGSYMPSGSGPVIDLFFTATTVSPGIEATINLVPSNPAVEPYFYFEDGDYRPVAVDGKVSMYTSCCTGRVGDANNSGEDMPTIGDISIMIDAKFISEDCINLITCPAEADINISGGSDPTCEDITIGDISMLIDYLFITGPETYGPLPDCQ